jgi:GNAT acetyltransferase-like protein
VWSRALSGQFGHIPGLDATGGASAEIGLYWVTASSHQRHGYASEAARALAEYGFETLQVHRLMAMTNYDYAASISVMRKLGMRVERNSSPEPPWLQVVGVLPASAMTRTGSPTSTSRMEWQHS